MISRSEFHRNPNPARHKIKTHQSTQSLLIKFSWYEQVHEISITGIAIANQWSIIHLTKAKTKTKQKKQIFLFLFVIDDDLITNPYIITVAQTIN